METDEKERIRIYQKRNTCFIGIDIHKDTHCAVVIDCWMNKLGEVSFENRPSKFPAFVEDVRRICGTKEFVFGLDDTAVGEKAGLDRKKQCHEQEPATQPDSLQLPILQEVLCPD